jgi:hypothetical protein
LLKVGGTVLELIGRVRDRLNEIEISDAPNGVTSVLMRATMVRFYELLDEHLIAISPDV